MAFFSALAAVYWKPAADDINDASYYMDLARHPLHFPRAPFGFRILTPYLVWLSHLSPDYAFTAITVLSLGAAAAFLYLYLREIYSARVALFGVALFAVCPAPLIELKNPVDVDSLFFAMVALSFLALARRRWLLLGFALVIGVLDKETMLFVLLPLAVVAVSEYRLRPYRRWVALFGFPCLAFALLHYTPIVFRPAPHNYNYFSFANISFVFRAQHVINGGGPGYSFSWSLVDTFGVLWVLAALLARRADRLVRHTAIFIVPVVASVLIATDWSRMLAVAFIVIIPLVCAAGLERPVASVVLFCSYAAVVPLGIDTPGLHPSFALFVPLLAVGMMAALVTALPRRAPRVAPRVVPSPATAADGTVRVRPATLTPAADVRRGASILGSVRGATASATSPSVRPAPAASQSPRVAPTAPGADRVPRVAPTAPGGDRVPRVIPAAPTAPAASDTPRVLPAEAPAASVASRPREVLPAEAPAASVASRPREVLPAQAPAATSAATAGLRAALSHLFADGSPASGAPERVGPPQKAQPPPVPAPRQRVGVRHAVPTYPDSVGGPADVVDAVARRPSPPRSEPVVHLEIAETLLADVQQLLARAAASTVARDLGPDTTK